MITLIDTGPLVAYVNRRDHWHHWSKKRMGTIQGDLVTCEAVLSECVFLLQGKGLSVKPIFDLIAEKAVHVKSAFTAPRQQTRVTDIINKYASLPASFADACLVHMAETRRGVDLCTIDTHFHIYRTSKGKPIPLIIPS